MKKNESCNAWEDLLALRLEDLSSAEHASLEAHLAACPACAAINTHYRLIQVSLAALPTPTMEPVPYGWKQESRQEEKQEQQEPWEETLKRNYDYIQRLVRQYVPNSFFDASLDEARLVDELVQETFIRLYHALERRPIANPQAYIKAVVHTVYIDWLRRQRRQIFAIDQSTDVSGSSHPSLANVKQQELRYLLEKIVEQVLILPPRQRQAMPHMPLRPFRRASFDGRVVWTR